MTFYTNTSKNLFGSLFCYASFPHWLCVLKEGLEFEYEKQVTNRKGLWEHRYDVIRMSFNTDKTV